MAETLTFNQLVNDATVFAGWRRLGIPVTEQQKTDFSAIRVKWLQEFEGNKAAEGGMGGSIQQLFYLFVSSIQKLLGSFLGNAQSTTADQEKPLTTATEQSKLKALHMATLGMRREMLAAGFDPRAIETATGQKTTAGPNDPEFMDEGVYAQIRRTINLPWGTSTSLNRNHYVAEFTPTPTPPSMRNPALTPGRG